MPAVTVSYPERDPDTVDRLSEKERRERGDQINKFWKYYKGQHRKPLKVKVGQADDNVILNLSKILVKRNASALFGQGVTFSTDELGSRNEQETYLDAVWNGGMASPDMNKKQILMNDLAINGFVTGSPALKLTIMNDRPHIINVDPGSVVIFWDEANIENHLWYSIYWSPKTRQDIVLFGNDTGDSSWVIFDYRRPDRGKWELVNEEEWPYAWCPLTIWKNLPCPNEVYGESDLEHAVLNDVINFIVSNVNRILQKHGHPKTIGLGFDAGEVVQDEIGSLLTVDKPPSEASVFTLEMESDLASSMKFYDEVRAVFFALGSSIDLRTFKDKIGDITNFGLQLLFKETIDTLVLKRALYGEAFAEINSHILELGGFGEGIQVFNSWPPSLPMNMLELLEAVERKRALGVISKETAAKDLGVDYEREQDLMADETTDLGEIILRNASFNQGA